MKEKTIIIKFKEYKSINQLSAEDKELLEKAIQATEGSYAPYSKFNVGAAVRLDNNTILCGANQENAAYPSGLCAERTTIFYAHSKYPNTPIIAIAIAAKNMGELTDSPTYPCGACCQVLNESQVRGGKPIKIILGSKNKILVIDSVQGLLPFAFDNLPQD